MVFVKAKRGDSNDSIVKKFLRKVGEEDILNQIRDRQFHKTASDIRKEKRSRFRHR